MYDEAAWAAPRENPYEGLCISTWAFGDLGHGEYRSLEKARYYVCEQIRAANPKHVLSIQEKEKEIVIYMII